MLAHVNKGKRLFEKGLKKITKMQSLSPNEFNQIAEMQSREGKEKRLSVKQYLNNITPYLYDLINDHRIARRVWKIQISIHAHFISSRDTGETLKVLS